MTLDVVIISSSKRTKKQSAAVVAWFNFVCSLILQDATMKRSIYNYQFAGFFLFCFFLFYFLKLNFSEDLPRMRNFSWLIFSVGNFSARWLSNLLIGTRDPPSMWNLPTGHVLYYHEWEKHELPIRLVLFNEQNHNNRKVILKLYLWIGI